MTRADAKVPGYSATPSRPSWWPSACRFSDGCQKSRPSAGQRRSVDRHHYRQPGVQGTGADRQDVLLSMAVAAPDGFGASNDLGDHGPADELEVAHACLGQGAQPNSAALGQLLLGGQFHS